jgi:hypothetical protein
MKSHSIFFIFDETQNHRVNANLRVNDPTAGIFPEKGLLAPLALHSVSKQTALVKP